MSVASRPWSFEATGTQWQVESSKPLNTDMQARILEWVRTFEATWSRFRPGFLVATLADAEHGGTFVFPAAGRT